MLLRTNRSHRRDYSQSATATCKNLFFASGFSIIYFEFTFKYKPRPGCFRYLAPYFVSLWNSDLRRIGSSFTFGVRLERRVGSSGRGPGSSSSTSSRALICWYLSKFVVLIKLDGSTLSNLKSAIALRWLIYFYAEKYTADSENVHEAQQMVCCHVVMCFLFFNRNINKRVFCGFF
jgi:hypothetical protein